MGALGKKKGLLLAFVTIVLVAGAGIAAWRFFSDTDSGPERALPLVEGQAQIIVKMEDSKIYKDKLFAVIRLLESAADFPSPLLPDRALGGSIQAVQAYADALISLLDMAEGAAFLFTRGDDGHPRFYLSFIPDGSAFDELVEGSGNLLFSVETWAEASGGEGWIARPAFPAADLLGLMGELPVLYLQKTGRSQNAPVLVSGSPEAIGEMKKAFASGSARARITRHNPAPDYIQAQYPVKTPSGETAAATAEIAWIEDATSAHAQFHTDAFSLMTGRAVPKSGLRGEDLPFLGDGDLAFVAAADIPYACFTAFPTADDPVAEAMGAFGSVLPGQYRDDLRRILAEGRISFVVVEAEDETETEPGTAYLVLETKETGALSRLLMLPKVLMRSASLAGWDSCHTMGIKGFNLVLAQRGDMLLLGVGELANFRQEARIPDGIKDFAAPRDLADLVATPSFWNIARPLLRERMLEYGVDASLIDSLAFKPCTVQLRVITPEKADVGFYWEDSSAGDE